MILHHYDRGKTDLARQKLVTDYVQGQLPEHVTWYSPNEKMSKRMAQLLLETALGRRINAYLSEDKKDVHFGLGTTIRFRHTHKK